MFNVYIHAFPYTEEEDYKYLQFDDSLVTISDTGKELGEFVISVKPAVHKVYRGLSNEMNATIYKVVIYSYILPTFYMTSI